MRRYYICIRNAVLCFHLMQYKDSKLYIIFFDGSARVYPV